MRYTESHRFSTAPVRRKLAGVARYQLRSSILTLTGLIALMLLLVIADASVKVRRQYGRAVISAKRPQKRLP